MVRRMDWHWIIWPAVISTTNDSILFHQYNCVYLSRHSDVSSCNAGFSLVSVTSLCIRRIFLNLRLSHDPPSPILLPNPSLSSWKTSSVGLQPSILPKESIRPSSWSVPGSEICPSDGCRMMELLPDELDESNPPSLLLDCGIPKLKILSGPVGEIFLVMKLKIFSGKFKSSSFSGVEITT